MPSVTEIYNGVLYLVGATAIIDPDERNGRIINNFYPVARDEVLAAAEWNFAMERKQLSQLVDAPAFEFTYQYALPSDPYCLRVVEVYDTYNKWLVEGRKLLTNDSTCKVRYIKRVEDSMQFQPIYVKALQLYLASMVAFPIQRDRGLAGYYMELYGMAINEAMTANSAEGDTSEIINTELTDTRR